MDKLFDSLLRNLNFDIRHYDIPMANIPEAFHGFTLLQISDLHIDHWNIRLVERAIDVINGLNPDMIVCTGDSIAEGNRYLGDIQNLLGQLQAGSGKIACLGNHDYSDGLGSHGVRRALNLAGFNVLVNESFMLSRTSNNPVPVADTAEPVLKTNAHIRIAGADDLILGKQCLHQTSRDWEPEIPTILLSHNPENFKAMAHFQPDLVLSGHTHGGQIYVSQWIHQYLFRSPYIAGLYSHRSSKLYVNRGLGSAVFVHHLGNARLTVPTPRWAVHPEISVFRLIDPAKSLANSC